MVYFCFILLINNIILMAKNVSYHLRGFRFKHSIQPQYFSYFRYEQINYLELHFEILSQHNIYYKFFNEKTIKKFKILHKINLVGTNSVLTNCTINSTRLKTKRFSFFHLFLLKQIVHAKIVFIQTVKVSPDFQFINLN